MRHYGWVPTSQGACPGGCNSSWRKARALYEKAAADQATAIAKMQPGQEAPEPPQAPEMQPWPGEPVWCTRCQAALRRQLQEIDVLAGIVGADDPRTRTEDDAVGRIRSTPMAPSPSSAMDALDEVASWLRGWESIARGTGEALPRHGYLAKEITETSSWLVFHFEQIITEPTGAEDFGTEIRRWHRELSTLAAAGQANKHRKKRCPRCRLYTLWWRIGDPYVRCISEDCGRMLSLAEYDAMEDRAA